MWLYSVIRLFMQLLSGTDKSICHWCSDFALIRLSYRISHENVSPKTWLCVDLLNGSQKWWQCHAILHPGTPCPGTPHPSQWDDIDEPSAFDVIPGEASECTDFLSEKWAIDMSFNHHFKLMFNTSYPVASMINHTGFTLVPASIQSQSQDILLAFSNNHGKKEKRDYKVLSSCASATTESDKQPQGCGASWWKERSNIRCAFYKQKATDLPIAPGGL